VASKAISANIVGGSALEKHLREVERHLGRGAHVRVGFLENATYPAKEKGKRLHVAQVAFWDHYGTIRSPARPFITDMIERKSPRWGVSLGNLLKQTNYDSEKALALMGEGIKGQLQASIRNWSTPPNAPSTVARKGFNKPLIETAVMLRSVDFQVMRGLAGEDES